MLLPLNINLKRFTSAAIAAAFFALQLPVFALAGSTAFAEETAGATGSTSEEVPREEQTVQEEEQPPVEPREEEINKSSTQPVILTEGEDLTEKRPNGPKNNLGKIKKEKELEAPVIQVADTARVTLCHATGSNTNPYVAITVAAAAAYNGHYGTGNGTHQDGEDIIPSFVYRGVTYPAQNMTTANAALLANNCVGDETPDTASVTICHATGSGKYVQIKNISAAGVYNGHLGNDHQDGEDIIPPFVYQGQTYSQNWDAAGQAIFANDCEVGGQGGGDEKITICHATGSGKYVRIQNISEAGVVSGHLGADHQNGEDIIPPFEYQGQTYSQNWDAAGQAIFNNNCVVKADEDKDKVVLCHATGSATNPYVKIETSAAGAFNGHLGADHQNGEDIIPPFEYQGQTYSQNWDAAGQAIFANDCELGGGRGGNPIIRTDIKLPTVVTVVTAAPAKVVSAKAATNITAGELANTGNSMWGSIFAAIAIMALTASLAIPVRRFQN